MRGFDHATILSPSFHGVHKERLAQWPAFCDPKNDQTFRGGDTSRKIGWECAARFPKPLPYFRPKSVIFLTLFQTWSPGARRMTSCYGMYMVVGVNIKKEMVLPPNDEEVANSSKNIPNSRLECTNHILFQTKMVEIDTLFQARHIPI